MNDKWLKCVDCGAEFIFSVREQRFFKEMGFRHEPKRCEKCRHKRREEKKNVPSTQPANR